MNSDHNKLYGIKFLLLNISAFIIDSSIVFALSIIVNFVLIKYFYFEILKVYLWVLFFYLTASYIWKGKTPAKYLLNIQLNTKEGNKPAFIEILKRELICKYLAGLIIPYYIIYISGYNDFYFNIYFVIVFFIVFTLFFWLFTKKTWWDALVKTKLERINTIKKKRQYLYFILLLFWTCSFFLIRFINNQNQKSELNFLGFNNPEKYDYPHNEKIDEYMSFLSKQSLSPKDYIFELFKKNDIVILCERIHPEITQWDFIYDLISDKRFIDSVGNIFTEYGNQDKQSMVDTFLNTKFRNDTLLEKSAANIMHYILTIGPFWNNSNFFYFLKKLNALNNTLPDSLKIREYFTNQTSWDFVNNRKQYDSITNMYYDSIMAANVINHFKDIQKKDKRKKCLVITNYRHAFIRNFPKQSEDEGTYIFNEFPQKTANVLINTVVMRYPIKIFWIPIQNGSWDKAFSLIGNKHVGFDFKGSPFGEDVFELNQHFPLGRKNKNKYQDIFTGFVFINPIEDFRDRDSYPYIMDGFEKEFTRRRSIIFNDTVNTSSLIGYYKELGNNNLKSKTFYLSYYNCVEFVCLLLLFASGFLISTYHTVIFSFKNCSNQ